MLTVTQHMLPIEVNLYTDNLTDLMTTVSRVAEAMGKINSVVARYGFMLFVSSLDNTTSSFSTKT